ncbi:triple gene block 3 [Lagenaria mild mosaic virus]|uniref:Movement protein TGBp3 n=1 Tax=Lagenaria mild mosaic virus TaxID=717848 RepID=E0D4K3_9VIRU|nr:triple gene block 3 [Lagenaria mild mosaic virus]BAJ17500.1 triple gene block 3 [Lagenaria mild mosaic virus]
MFSKQEIALGVLAAVIALAALNWHPRASTPICQIVLDGSSSKLVGDCSNIGADVVRALGETLARLRF